MTDERNVFVGDDGVVCDSDGEEITPMKTITLSVYDGCMNDVKGLPDGYELRIVQTGDMSLFDPDDITIGDDGEDCVEETLTND